MPGWGSVGTVRPERGEDEAEGGGCRGRDALMRRKKLDG